MSYCSWGDTEINKKYHAQEWGVPLHDERGQFEYLMLEAMQCGLSWSIVLKKREIFRRCFDNFDFKKIAQYTEKDIERIMNTDGMIRSKRKIEAVINNAKCFLNIQKDFGSFDKYLWAAAGGKTILYDKHELGYIPVSNGLSEKISKDLKKRGFKYLGSRTIYSHLQACGIINDHDASCPRYKFINENFPTVKLPCDNEKGVMHFA